MTVFEYRHALVHDGGSRTATQNDQQCQPKHDHSGGHHFISLGDRPRTPASSTSPLMEFKPRDRFPPRQMRDYDLP